MLLNFIRPIGNSTHKIYDLLGIKLLTRLRLGFSHLLSSYLSHLFSKALMTDLKNINDAILSLNESDLVHVMLYGSKKFDNNMNISILTATI